MNSPDQKRCPECGVEISSNAPGGLCPRCVAKGLLASDEPVIGAAVSTDPLPHDPIADSPGAIIGNYRLIEKIGEGGFGIVYLAEQRAPVQRQVALKVIKPGMDTRQVVARFEAERQALALMDHTNIAQVYDAGATPAGRPYFVMELVQGMPITIYCDQQKLPVRSRLRLFMDVCQAVQHAHQKGLIHRDLKPSNVLVTVQDDKPVPKVIDFGVAKALDMELTEKTLFTVEGQMMGTPLYMSPEQAGGGEDIDTRSDVYSLGVLLYELLTGTTPLEPAKMREAGWGEIERLIQEQEPPQPSLRITTPGERTPEIAALRSAEPSSLSRIVRGDLDWIVMKALEKDRTRRYETANNLSEDLLSFLNQEPVKAGPPTAVYRMRKFIHRNRALVTAAGSIGVVLLAITAISTWLAIEATNATKLADERLVEVQAAREEEQRLRKLADERLADTEAARKEEQNQREIADKERTKAEEQAALAEKRKEELESLLIESKLAEQLLSFDSQEMGAGAAVTETAHTARLGSPTRFAEHTLGLLLFQRGLSLPTMRPRRTPVTEREFTPALSDDGRLLLLDINTLETVAELPDASTNLLDAAANDDGSLVATLDWGGDLKLWDTKTDTVRTIKNFSSSEYSLETVKVTISQTGTRFSVGDPAREKRTIYATRDGNPIKETDYFSPFGSSKFWELSQSESSLSIRDLDLDSSITISDGPLNFPANYLLGTGASYFGPDESIVVNAGPQYVRFFSALSGEEIGKLEGRGADLRGGLIWYPSTVSTPPGFTALGDEIESIPTPGGVPATARVLQGLHVQFEESLSEDGRELGQAGRGYALKVLAGPIEPDPGPLALFTGSAQAEPDPSEPSALLPPGPPTSLQKDPQSFPPTGVTVAPFTSPPNQTAPGAALPPPNPGGASRPSAPQNLRVAGQQPSGSKRSPSNITRRDPGESAEHGDRHGLRFRLRDPWPFSVLFDVSNSGGRAALTWLGNPELQVLDTGSGSTISTVALPEIAGRIAMSRRGEKVAIASQSAIRILKIDADGETILAEIKDDSSLSDPSEFYLSIKDLCFNPDGTALAAILGHRLTGAQPHRAEIRIWNTEEGARDPEPLTIAQEEREPPAFITFSPDGKKLAICSKEGALQVRDSASGRELPSIQRIRGEVLDLKWTPDHLAALSIIGSRGYVINPESGDYYAAFPVEFSGWKLEHAALDPENRQVIMRFPGTLRAWPLFPVERPVPDWVFDEMVPVLNAGFFGDKSSLIDFPQRMGELKDRAAAADSDSDPFHTLLDWLLADRRIRTISPFESMTVPEWVEMAVKQATSAGAPFLGDEAYAVSPSHPLVHIALAGFEKKEERADFLREFGLKRFIDPENIELYTQKTMARYARNASKMLSEQGDDERARKVLAYAEKMTTR